MKDNLEQLRREWEGEAEVVAEKTEQIGSVTLVVLKDEFGGYRCHRYFPAGDEWAVSVDGETLSAETVIQWLCNPSARTCRVAQEDTV